MTVRLLIGDALTRLRELDDASAHMVCTSPPYYSLRAYGTNPQVWGGDPACSHSWQEQRYYVEGGGTAGSSKEAFSEPGAENAARIKAARWREDAYCTRCTAWRGELGSEPTPEQYVANLVAVFREVRRVLHPTGVLVLNLGDSYAGSGKGPTGHTGIGDQAERQGFTGGRGVSSLYVTRGYDTAKQANSQRRAPAVNGLPPKNLLMLPARVAMALQADGWFLRSVMPWLKRAAMPESVTDRPSNALEWLFLFSKQPRYFWDAEAIRQGVGQESRRAASFRDGGVYTNHRADMNSAPAWKETHGDGEPSLNGRSFRNTDPWFISLDAAIADARADLARLEALRATGGVLADDDGLPLAVDVNPQGFDGAHFATFAPNLVVPFVRAGTSERGCCPRCLAPWARLTERRFIPQQDVSAARVAHRRDTQGVPGQGWKGTPRGATQTDTLGWQPSCACDAGEPIPANPTPDLYCATCCKVIEWQHGKDISSTTSAVSDLRDVVQSEEAGAEVLLSGVLREGHSDPAATDVFALREGVSPTEPPDALLREGVREHHDGAGEGELSRLAQEHQGLHLDLRPDASPGIKSGLHAATSARGSAEGWPSATAGGSGPSPERDQGRQPPGESGSPRKARTRRDAKPPLHGDLPGVSARLSRQRECPHCRSRLVLNPIPCTVLDVFAGSGTTLLVADRLGRDAIGIELSEAYADLARARLASDAPLWTDADDVEAGGYAPLALFGEDVS